MEQSPLRDLEPLLQEKIRLYEALKACLERERESLIHVDLDRLWDISREKDEIGARIRAARQELLTRAGEKAGDHAPFALGRVPPSMAGAHGQPLRTLRQRLTILKGEVEVMRRENMHIIEDSLRFLDGMISLLAGEAPARLTYNNRYQWNGSAPLKVLSKEA